MNEINETNQTNRLLLFILILLLLNMNFILAEQKKDERQKPCMMLLMNR